jgi:hypothetical protein
LKSRSTEPKSKLGAANGTGGTGAPAPLYWWIWLSKVAGRVDGDAADEGEAGGEGRGGRPRRDLQHRAGAAADGIADQHAARSEGDVGGEVDAAGRQQLDVLGGETGGGRRRVDGEDRVAGLRAGVAGKAGGDAEVGVGGVVGDVQDVGAGVVGAVADRVEPHCDQPQVARFPGEHDGLRVGGEARSDADEGAAGAGGDTSLRQVAEELGRIDVAVRRRHRRQRRAAERRAERGGGDVCVKRAHGSFLQVVGW